MMFSRAQLDDGCIGSAVNRDKPGDASNMRRGHLAEPPRTDIGYHEAVRIFSATENHLKALTSMRMLPPMDKTFS